uniref:Glycosyl transferase n=1 Tax=Rhabditophanes sp. KR3021 TaxID=114890 RepID=A0AC35U1U9_9BILA
MDMTTIIAKFALEEGVSFSLAESIPFKQALRSNKINDDSIHFPTKQTIKEYVMKTAELTIAENLLIVRKSIHLYGGTFAVDYGKRINDYLSIICHYFKDTDNGLTLCSTPIGFLKSFSDLKDSSQVWIEMMIRINF